MKNLALSELMGYLKLFEPKLNRRKNNDSKLKIVALTYEVVEFRERERSCRDIR